MLRGNLRAVEQGIAAEQGDQGIARRLDLVQTGDAAPALLALRVLQPVESLLAAVDQVLAHGDEVPGLGVGRLAGQGQLAVLIERLEESPLALLVAAGAEQPAYEV